MLSRGGDEVYAVVGKWVMDPNQRDAQQRVLQDEIVSMVKAAPGFVSAQWTRSVSGDEHVSFVEFEDQASAERFADVVRSDPHRRDDHGVASSWLAVTEVIASA
jgi:heme-degrading monooxygenase HmoA